MTDLVTEAVAAPLAHPGMVGLMWDSVTPELIPSWARLKALYINGKFASHPDYGRGRIFIDVTGAAPFAAEVLDVETGDANPAHVAPWLDKREKWETGTIYCDRANLPAVVDAAGHRPFWLWLATLDGTVPPHVETGSGTLVAVQAISALLAGANVDISAVVHQGWWSKHALPPIR